ncbi:SDR family NAD(P)-dependent oxidoreductase [Mycobacterium kansasii]
MSIGSLGSDLRSDIARILAASPDTLDYTVIERCTEAGEQRLVAYVVPAQPVTSRGVRDTITAGAPQAPVDVVLVSSVPRTASGAADIGSLAMLPVLDEMTLARTEAAMQSACGAAAEMTVAFAPASADGYAGAISTAQPSAREPVRDPLAPAAVLSGGQARGGGPATLGALLVSAAAECPYRDALRLLSRDGRPTVAGYDELLDEAQRVCGGLQERGLRPGDRIVLACGEPTGFVPGFWGAVLAGLIVVPSPLPDTVEPQSAIQALQAVMSSAAAAVVVTDLTTARNTPGFADIDQLRAARPGSLVSRSPDDLVLGLPTSGSTGKPKLVGQTHRAVLSNAASACAHNGFRSDEISLNWFPLDHVGGLVMFHIRDVWLRCRQVQVPTDKVLREPLTWLELVDRYRITVTWAPNFAYQLVTARLQALPTNQRPAWDLSCLTFILNGGEPIIADQCLNFLSALAPYGLPAAAMHPAWGMSETCSGVVYSAAFAPGLVDRTSTHVPVGQPVPGCTVRVVDDTGAVQHHGQPGQLQVRGPMIAAGYLDDDAATAAALDPDGWLHTGDRAVIGPAGLTIIGRDKDVIIVGGRNITASEVEAVVDKVCGVDPSWSVAFGVRAGGAATEQIAVVFVPLPGHPVAEVAERVRRAVLREFHVSPTPIHSVTRNDVAKTSIGKPKRALIRERLLGCAPGADIRPAVVEVLCTPTLESATPGPALPVLLLSDREEFTAALAQALRSRGHTLSTSAFELTDAQERRRIRSLLDGGPEHVVHVLPVGPPTPDEVAGRCADLAALLRVMEQTGGSRLSVVAPTGCEYGQSLAAFAHSAGRDLPRLKVRFIGSAVSPEAVADELSREEPAEVDLGLPVRRILTTAAAPIRAAGESALQRAGRYLVIGGLGGVGRHVCEYLLRQFGAHLLVVGTSELDCTQPAGPRGRNLLALREMGDVTYLAVDVADAMALRAAVEVFEQQHGGPIDGMFALAGELVPRSAVQLSAADIDDMLYAKGRGAIAVERLLAERAHAIEVYFTSVHSLVGAPELAAYAAANRFQDVLAARHRDRGRRAWSIAWSRWAGPGMSLDVAGGDLAAEMGLATIDPAVGIDALDAVLRSRPGWYAVGLDTGNRRLAHLAGGLRPLERIEVRMAGPATDVTAAVTDAFGVPVPAHVVGQQPAGPPAPAAAGDQGSAMAVLAGIWAELLKLPDVSAADDFFELGGHSLLVPRLQERVLQLLGVALPAVAVFEYPTLRELARVIEDRSACEVSRADQNPPPADDPRANLRRRASLREASRTS